MATIFRPKSTTYKLPDGGCRTPEGKRVDKNTPGAVAFTSTSPIYHGRYREIDGQWKRVRLCSDKTAAQQMLAKLITDASLASVGLPSYEQHRKRLLTDHLSDYQRHLEAKNNNPRHISQAIAHCKAVFSGIHAQFIRELDAGRVATWLADQRRAAFSIATSNHYLTSVKGFCRWLVRDRRTATDPMVYLSKLDEDTDIRRRRRDLSADQARGLLAAAKASKREFRGLTGEDRFFLYAVALQTGLRAGELASLTTASFSLDTEPPVVNVQAAYTKDRKEVNQPIPDALANVLGDFLAQKRTDVRIWPGTWHARAYKMIAADLEAAGILQTTDAGTIDFHALRHTYITMLSKSGVAPRMAQSLARHSSIDLTMNVYTHVGLYDQASALESFPTLMDPTDNEKRMRATGTDGRITDKLDSKSIAPCTRPDIRMGQSGDKRDVVGTGDDSDGSCGNAVNTGDFARREGENARVGEGTRTPDFQSHSLTL